MNIEHTGVCHNVTKFATRDLFLQNNFTHTCKYFIFKNYGNK